MMLDKTTPFDSDITRACFIDFMFASLINRLLNEAQVPCTKCKCNKGLSNEPIVSTDNRGVDNNNNKNTKVNSEDIENTPEYYLNYLAYTWQTNTADVCKTLNRILTVSPGAFNSILLSVISRFMDAKYGNHISEAEEIYILDTTTGKICKIYTEDIKKVSFKFFSAFRTGYEAVAALRIVGKIKSYISSVNE